jgi:hypothetical protein
MSAGYSGTPLIKKLGIKEGYKAVFIHPPDNYFSLLGELPQVDVADLEARYALDFVHLFVKTREELFPLLDAAKGRIKQTGMIWVSWPKKSSKVSTDISEDVIRARALNIGLVDVKVCAVDEIWSGLKLVIPINKRS